jgi:hypothetical protein
MTTTRNLEFEGLERLDTLILKLREDIGYVSVEEVLTRSKTAMVGRADFSITELAMFLGPEPKGDDAHEDDAPSPLGDLASAPLGPTSRDLAEAMTRFVRHTMAANMMGCPRRVFKVSVWRPKGDGQYGSGRVTCIDPDFSDDEDLGFDEPAQVSDVLALPAPQPPPPATVVVQQAHVPAEFMPEARPWRALSEAYTNMIGLLQSSYNHLANLQSHTINAQNQQNIRLQRVMEVLVGELTSLRLGVNEAADDRRADESATRLQTELGREFIGQIGAVGRAYVASKTGLPPEIVELVDLVGASPELVEALRAPEVKELLKDEATRKELANVLLNTAKTVKAHTEAFGTTPKPDGASPAA